MSMLIRNGVKSTLRERGRATLFFFLLLALTLALVLALGVLLYCNAEIRQCDEQFHSVALVEYMGEEYPHKDVSDLSARTALRSIDESAVLAVPGVKSWRTGTEQPVYYDRYARKGGTMPYADRSILILGGFGNPAYYTYAGEEYMYYQAVINESVYSKYGEDGITVNLVFGDYDFTPERGKLYAVHGSLSLVAKGGHPLNGMKTLTMTAFEDSDELPFAENPDGQAAPAVFRQAAERYRHRNDYIRVIPCADVNNVYEFQQGELHLEQGEFPDPSKPGQCVITKDLAERADLEIGNSFTVEKLVSADDDFYDLRTTGAYSVYTVAGVVEASYTDFGEIWAIGESADATLFGYLLGTAAVENEPGEDATEQIRALLPEGARVTLLDQGYGETVKPFREVRNTALNVLIVSAAGVLTVLLLFAFLFVGKQSYSIGIMVSLGTPRRKVALWMLSGALVIAALAAAAGTAIGVALQPLAIRFLHEYTIDGLGQSWQYIYSETELSAVKAGELTLPKLPLAPSLIAGGAIVLAALLLCGFFLLLAYRGGTRKKGKSRVRVPKGKTSPFGFGPWRFARLSILRGGMRTLVVPLVCLVLTVAILFLGGVYQGWINERDETERTTQIDAIAMSLNGRQYSRLAIPVQSVRKLQEVPLVEDVGLSAGWHYWRPEEVPPFSRLGFGEEHRSDWIATQPDITAVNDLHAAKEFYYTEPKLTWLEGWDESMLQANDVPMLFFQDIERRNAVDEAKRAGTSEEKAAQDAIVRIPAILGDKYMQEHGIRLGDDFDCWITVSVWEFMTEQPVYLKVVGQYTQGTMKAQIYVPLASYLSEDILSADANSFDRRTYPLEVDRETDRYRLREGGLRDYLGTMAAFSTCRFRLPSAADLEALREQLFDAEFSAVGLARSVRTAIVLQDAAFLKFRESMDRNILIGLIMGVAISALVILLGFLISWLMTNARKREFALMRGFGASKVRVFLSFFHEQLLLSLLGCLLGGLALFRTYVGGWFQLAAAAGFFVCYMLGCFIAIRVNGRMRLMELLTVRE